MPFFLKPIKDLLIPFDFKSEYLCGISLSSAQNWCLFGPVDIVFPVEDNNGSSFLCWSDHYLIVECWGFATFFPKRERVVMVVVYVLG